MDNQTTYSCILTMRHIDHQHLLLAHFHPTDQGWYYRLYRPTTPTQSGLLDGGFLCTNQSSNFPAHFRNITQYCLSMKNESNITVMNQYLRIETQVKAV